MVVNNLNNNNFFNHPPFPLLDKEGVGVVNLMAVTLSIWQNLTGFQDRSGSLRVNEKGVTNRQYQFPNEKWVTNRRYPVQ